MFLYFKLKNSNTTLFFSPNNYNMLHTFLVLRASSEKAVLGGVIFVLIWVHGLITNIFGSISFCESSIFKPILLLSCFCKIYIYICLFLHICLDPWCAGHDGERQRSGMPSSDQSVMVSKKAKLQKYIHHFINRVYIGTQSSVCHPVEGSFNHKLKGWITFQHFSISWWLHQGMLGMMIQCPHPQRFKCFYNFII